MSSVREPAFEDIATIPNMLEKVPFFQAVKFRKVKCIEGKSCLIPTIRKYSTSLVAPHAAVNSIFRVCTSCVTTVIINGRFPQRMRKNSIINTLCVGASPTTKQSARIARSSTVCCGTFGGIMNGSLGSITSSSMR